MTKEQLADLVSDMRAKQKFERLWPKNADYRFKACEAEHKVDEAVRNIFLGKW